MARRTHLMGLIRIIDSYFEVKIIPMKGWDNRHVIKVGKVASSALCNISFGCYGAP